MEAQTIISSPAGEYYLRGVMETACGFKLNSDSTFQFFFSYGALDRYGEGRWKVENNTIVFNSKPKPAHDFALINSTAGEKTNITIHIQDENIMLRKYVHCKIRGGGKEQEAVMNEEGIATFSLQPVETIELVFEFCPEKVSVFTINNRNERRFTFRAEPWLMETFFQNFRLTLTDDGLTGGHPFSTETSFHYEKTTHQ